jgi:hypothetical protein
VLALTAATAGSAWNAGGSILTFYFPIGLFVVIAALLSMQFGRPHAVPGRKPLALARASTTAAETGQQASADDNVGPAASQSRDVNSAVSESPGADDTGDKAGSPEAGA